MADTHDVGFRPYLASDFEAELLRGGASTGSWHLRE